MDRSSQKYFENCLYFTANSLARAITRMAEEEFGKLGMSSSQAFLLMLAIEKPGISQKELAEHLDLAPSTVSRFADALVRRELLEKKSSGKYAMIYPTDKGTELSESIHLAWHSLYEKYVEILGREEAEMVTGAAFLAAQKLSNPE